MKDYDNKLCINLLGNEEQRLRLERVYAGMAAAGISAALIRSNANLYYLCGRVFRGYIYISPALAQPLYFVRRPSTLKADGKNVFHIRKPEDIAGPVTVAGTVALELGALDYCEAMRLAAVFGMPQPQADISSILRRARAVKTPFEQQLLIRSGEKQSLVYRRIPHLYREGMSDIELQIEIERLSRLEGCLGQFRIAGSEMELFMGSVLTGDNADEPSPYDFAMGGAGLDASIPVGADGTVIKPGMPVMVDVNGNYTGYMTDMTRCYYTGTLNAKAQGANELSAEICRRLASMMKPGVAAADLYHTATEMAEEAGMGEYFMGHRSHAGFVGHGVGIEVNELPVIAPRSRDVLELGNVIAIEPKFVIPDVGAVGIENTYFVEETGGRVITTAPEEACKLD